MMPASPCHVLMASEAARPRIAEMIKVLHGLAAELRALVEAEGLANDAGVWSVAHGGWCVRWERDERTGWSERCILEIDQEVPW